MIKDEMVGTIGILLVFTAIVGVACILIGAFFYLEFLFRIILIAIGILLLISVVFGFKKLSELEYG